MQIFELGMKHCLPQCEFFISTQVFVNVKHNPRELYNTLRSTNKRWSFSIFHARVFVTLNIIRKKIQLLQSRSLDRTLTGRRTSSWVYRTLTNWRRQKTCRSRHETASLRVVLENGECSLDTHVHSLIFARLGTYLRVLFTKNSRSNTLFPMFSWF